ncbi:MULTISPECIES: ABC transporter permease [Anaerotruncus]|jgi:putative ABC transport system permease protein|uniref:FtsX-like permease family protein n=1 Tax=Anaerotruncus colihominis TaxID=169435 RepID=A0A845SVW2_9FIRM|nr:MULTISPECIES: ABC transporter permease [Anaerotruncus]MCI8491628.1 FtsX-like permease family protein [Anaerotruncus sp.]MCR2025766.1 ABC transporter permease [Anaerotruncus colihominis]NBI77785.1 FtsX-like permease family protein [Anaerotruncus colihominis]NDO38683.1 FtsX-like permease family protein [Anaerotruncus colihominis]
MLFDSFVCSLRNLGRKRFRSFLTIASIAIGVASVVLIGSIGEIGKQTISDELNSLGLGSLTVSADQKFTRQKMDQRDLELIRDLPTVKSATPVVVDFSSIRMRGLVANAMLWGVDCKGDQLISLKSQYGRLLNEADIAGASDVCVIDANVAQMFYKRDNIVGKYLDAMIGGSYVRLEIVGVAVSGGNILQTMVGDVIPSFAYVPYTTIQRYTGDQAFEQIAVTLHDNSNSDAAAEQLTASVNRLHNINRGFKAENISKQKDTLNNLLGIITIVLSSIAAVSLVVAGLGIMTVMTVSVNERTREIGIKKSIGATRGTILLEFLIEAFTISLIGSMAGVGVGLFVVWSGCTLLHIPVSIAPWLIAISIILTVGIGMIFGVYPATVAARMRPVDALRTD